MVPDEFKSASFADQFRHDFAIVSLPDSEMTDRTGTVPGGIAVLTEEAFVNPSSRFAVAGYPYDCNDRVCGEAAFDSLYGLGDHAWLAPTTFAWASPNLVYHDADEFDGMSGGPLLRTSDMALAGIVSGTDPFLARSLKLTHPVVERLAQWCRQNGCSLDLARPSAAAPRPYRAVALAIATDSASGLCVTERSFLERLAAADEEFLPALAEFLQTMPEEDFDPGSPAWRAGFERAYGPLKPAADRMAALQPPNSRFEAYHHEVDEGLAEFMEGLELVKRAVDENSEDVFWEGVVLISTGADHFEDAAEVYPGVHSACLAPLGSPFALPPARR